MSIDLFKFYTYFFDHHTFYEYVLQKNIDDYEEQNKGVKVRENDVYFKFIILVPLTEVDMHYSKHRLGADEKKMEMLNNQLIDDFENLKEIYGEDIFDLIQTKKDHDFLLKHNYETPSCLHYNFVK